MSTTGKKKKKLLKIQNIWRLNNTLLNNQQITEEILKKSKKKSKYAWKQMKMSGKNWIKN